MTVEVFGTDEFQSWFLDLSAEEQAAVINVVTKLEIAGVALGRPHTGHLVMAVHKWSDIKRKSKLSPERIAEIEREAEQEITEGDLRALREIAGKTQADVAKLIEKTQGELSRMERRSDHRLSTVRKLVEALGGELEVIAHVGSKRVRLRGV